MKTQKLGNVVTVMLLVTVVWLSVAPLALALGASYQPVEWATYQSGSPNYSISYAGLTRGCKLDQPNNYDQKFWVNLNASYDPDKFRIYSNDSTIQRNFGGKSPMGVNLNPTYGKAYLCLGLTDTAFAGGPANVASKLFVWISR